MNTDMEIDPKASIVIDVGAETRRDEFQSRAALVMLNEKQLMEAAIEYDAKKPAMAPKILVTYADVLCKLTGFTNIQPGNAAYVVQAAVYNAAGIVTSCR